MSRLRQLRAQQVLRVRLVRRQVRVQARLDMAMMSLMETTKKFKSEIQFDRAAMKAGKDVAR